MLNLILIKKKKNLNKIINKEKFIYVNISIF
jgi:hypothetical protein